MRDPQLVHRRVGNRLECLELPTPRSSVMPNVRWGRHDCLFTPAYWAAQAWLHRDSLKLASGRIGKSLSEEIAVCLLGGHGMPAEVGLAAFAKLRDKGLLDGNTTSVEHFETALREPLVIKGRRIQYRFARQRARFLADAMRNLPRIAGCVASSMDFRCGLLEVKGIGLKTASWIVRNWLGADDVAILDVHIIRAGQIAGFFPGSCNIARDYLKLEDQYLRFATGIRVRASRLDSLIWNQMKYAGSLARESASRALQTHAPPVMLAAA